MTIKRLGLSAVAASLIATGAFAGALSLGGIDNSSDPAKLVKSEPVTVSDILIKDSINKQGFDVNVTSTTAKQIVYQPTDFSTGQQDKPAVIFEISNGNWVLSEKAKKLKLIEDGDDTNKTVAKYKDHSGNTIIFDPGDNGVLIKNKIYKLVLDDNSTNLSGDLAVRLKNSEAKDVTLTISSGSSQTQTIFDTATGDFIKLVPEFSAEVSSFFSKKIDAAEAFAKFTKSATNDKAEIKLTRKTVDVKADATYAGTADVEVVFTYDQNLTGIVKESVPAGSVGYTAKMNDFNTTGTMSTYTPSNNDTFELQFDLEDDNGGIPETAFNASLTFEFKNLNDKLALLDEAKAGYWGIYGYNAQIPNAAGLDNYQTTLKFTNRSTIDAEIYITLIDPAGTKVTVDSENDGIASLAKGTTGTYRVSDLVAKATEKDSTFNGNGSVSIEVVVPTSPNSVYGAASFKNVQFGQFKDLPVYSNSEMTY